MIYHTWLKWPKTCDATVSRDHNSECCNKEAVAVALYLDGEFENSAYPVCKHHARGVPMMPLTEIIRIAQEETKSNE